nr:aminotransferase class V-fold PLP-dependent enzyme [Lachnospiraceae bacterium]
MIYLNNAATSYPKPESVIKAYTDALRSLPSGQFRSAGVSDNADSFSLCRQRLGRLMGIEKWDRIYFSSGSTEGLNALIAGLGIRADQVISTVTEHNSVLRPLYNLREDTGEPVLLHCNENGMVNPELFEAEAQQGRAKAVILNHCSNVTGAIQDIKAFGEIAKTYGLIFILDVSQSAGCMAIEADESNVDALAFTGHKSLMGVQGTGGYYVREGLELKPFKYGGTGLDSRKIRYDGTDYEYEPGTQNAPGIAALAEAANRILEKGIDKIRAKEKALSDRLIEGLSSMEQ